jgi:NAD(P)-dependent dehydrogenase (short-subunit alcohol dehydrogenase family)
MARGRFDVAGRTAFITGAARGIGAATAERLHARGANVALVGLEPELLEERAATLGDRAAVFEADVTDTAGLERAVAGAVERFGGIDVGVANAGIHTVGSLLTAPPEQVERTLEVNLMGVWRTDRAVLPQIVERRGYLLNIASLAAASHAPLMGPYAASKAGVEGLTDSLRVELKPTGARAGCAYFGFIDTDLVRASFEHPSTKAMEGMMPGFIRRSVPVAVAAETIERAIERRSGRAWAPRFVAGALAFRGIIQPLTELRAMRSRALPGALRLADPANGGLDGQDPVLGVAASAPNVPEPRP